MTKQDKINFYKKALKIDEAELARLEKESKELWNKFVDIETMLENNKSDFYDTCRVYGVKCWELRKLEKEEE